MTRIFRFAAALLATFSLACAAFGQAPTTPAVALAAGEEPIVLPEFNASVAYPIFGLRAKKPTAFA